MPQELDLNPHFGHFDWDAIEEDDVCWVADNGNIIVHTHHGPTFEMSVPSNLVEIIKRDAIEQYQRILA